MDDDTDTLIALVSSIIGDQSPEFSTSQILDALVKADADVERAAKHLIETRTDPAPGVANPSTPTTGKKRKRSGLDAWLDASASQKKLTGAKRRVSDPILTSDADEGPSSVDDPPTVSRIHAPASSARSVKQVDLMSVLRQPSTSPQKAKAPSPKKSKLKPPSTIPRLPPLSLPSPSLVAQHTPCTLHFSILPPELACKLFYTMVDLALGKSDRESVVKTCNRHEHGSPQAWKRNKWFLFDRMVESPHRTAFFVRQDLKDTPGDTSEKSGGIQDWTEAAQYWYNGTPTDAPPAFPAVMEEACYIVERMVNAELRKRTPHIMEWRPPNPAGSDVLWRANVAASNCYEGAKETVGWHSDQVTYLGPYPTIASLSLGTRRTFSLRDVVPIGEQEKRHARTYNIPLPHNSLIIMHASTQERFKHSIPPQRVIDVYKPILPRSAFWSSTTSVNGDSEGGADDKIEPSNIRINITFRFYRPDFRPETTPRCKCGIPMVLRPDMRYIVPRDKPTSSSGGVDSVAEKPSSSSGEQEYDMKYWWTCYAHAQNDGKGCGTWKVMDMDTEGRGWMENS